MPFIHIKSLRFEIDKNMPSIVSAIGSDFAEANNIPLFHVHTTWEFYEPGHYAKGISTPESHPDADHPVIVDLLTPDFNTQEAVEKMLTSLAASISKHADTDIRRVFINHRQAHPGMVFDDGDIVKW